VVTMDKSRLIEFLSNLIAISVVRLPLDLAFWAGFFYLGRKFGWYLFG
jgi:hypothetical protein